ncbi:hypothetical protein BDR06DRAFT_679052 [Suillus hirtellus]|nr:hypothetical protein BDR06DRAFT_679052 [Suillus hirtellus]
MDVGPGDRGIGKDTLPADLTPFITRTTQDHICGGGFGDVWKCNYNADAIDQHIRLRSRPLDTQSSVKIQREYTGKLTEKLAF